MSVTVIILLCIIIAMALFLPFFVHAVEKELETFLLVLGILAVTITGAWSGDLIVHAIKQPVGISLAVLVTGLLFRTFRKKITDFIELVETKFGLKNTIIFFVFTLSLLSSVITAIIAALVLCEIASTLKLSKRDTIHLIIMGFFAIGMGINAFGRAAFHYSYWQTYRRSA